MRQIERFDLIDNIGRELQSRMTYSDIDIYLKGFDIAPYEGEQSFNSKWVYTKLCLADAGDDVIIRIADELQIPHAHVVRPGRDVEESRFWQPGHFRLFLSHLSSFRGRTSALQRALKVFGVSSFVAHVDIRPTRKWEQEIENALFSMDALVAILMPGFKASDWTDQEVGVAVGRGVPIIPIMKGLTPYGFIAKYQGFDAGGKSVGQVSRAIVDILLENEMSGNKMWTALVDTLAIAPTESEASSKLEVLESLGEIPEPYLKRLRERVDEGGVFRSAGELRERLDSLFARHGVPKLGVERAFELPEASDDLPF